MNWKAWTYWLHKWSAATAVLLTLIWFVSGIIMVLPPRWFGAPSLPREGVRPRFRDIQVSVPQAIAMLEAELGRTLDIHRVDFRTVGGRLFYQVQTRNESHLVDVESSVRLVIDQEVAGKLLAGVLPQGLKSEITLLQEPDADYGAGALPAYRFRVADAARTNYYVAVPTGEIRATNRGLHWYRFLSRTHTLGFLRPSLGDRPVRMILIFFSVVGTLMTLFGAAILWIQFTNWRARRPSKSTGGMVAPR